MEHLPEAKSARLLTIYSRLVNGETLSRPQLAQDYNVSIRSIQRDIESLRCFLAEQDLPQEITYGKKQGGYRLELPKSRGLTSGEAMMVCKVLLENCPAPRNELTPILDKLIDCAVPEANRQAVRKWVDDRILPQRER